MSPEPTQEPVEENLNTSNLNFNVTNNSDSDNEDAEAAGYMPLSQVPLDGEPLIDDDDDNEWAALPDELHDMGHQNTIAEQELSVEPEIIQVWSSECDRLPFELDEEKIDQVKSVMASFTLPSTAIPEWANSISEDQWKERLIDRIKEMQREQK